MSKLSYKNKIYLVIAGWIVVTLVIFWYGFPLVENSNVASAGQILERNKKYQDLLQQQASFEAGKKDLGVMATKPYQPEEFFSKDTSVVKEIQVLEDLAALNNLKLELEVTGSKATASKASTASDIVQVPYTLLLTGTTQSLVTFLEYFENLKFITHTESVNISAVKDNQIKATVDAVFFIQK